MFAPLALAASRASVSRLRVSFQSVRSENISTREQVHLESGTGLNLLPGELVQERGHDWGRRPPADIVLPAAPFQTGPVADRNRRTEQVFPVRSQQLPQGLHTIEKSLP